jgi:hypothetical protein
MTDTSTTGEREPRTGAHVVRRSDRHIEQTQRGRAFR